LDPVGVFVHHPGSGLAYVRIALRIDGDTIGGIEAESTVS
jgi:hypothetical protein